DASAFDYSRQIAGVLTAAAAGAPGEAHRLEVRLPQKDLDLRLRAYLERFSDFAGVEKGEARFRITPATLERAAKIGVNHREVMGFLEGHGKLPLEADVLLTLRGWGGEIGAATLAEAVALVLPEGVLPQMTAIEEL